MTESKVLTSRNRLGWLGESGFWRAVAAQTTGTLAAAFLLTTFAIASGWLRTPTARAALRALGLTLIGLLALVALIGTVAIALRALDIEGARDQPRHRTLLLAGQLTATLLVFFAFIAYVVISMSSQPDGCTPDLVGTPACGDYHGQTIWPWDR